MSTATYDRRFVAMPAVGSAMVCAVLWGGQSVAVKMAVAELPAYHVMTLRFLLACLVLDGWAVVGRQSLRLALRQLPMVFAGALLLTAGIYRAAR